MLVILTFGGYFSYVWRFVILTVGGLFSYGRGLVIFTFAGPVFLRLRVSDFYVLG